MNQSSSLGLSFADVEANKKDAEVRLGFPSWRFIQAYYAAYFYVRATCLLKTSGFRIERHQATLSTFDHSVLPALEKGLWPWPLSVRYEPGKRIRRASLPVSRIAHLQYAYAHHPRPPHRSPAQIFEYLLGEYRQRARSTGRSRVYSIVDFLYDFRVWANYQDIDSMLALWGPGYRSIIDMNLATILFFVGASAEVAFASTQGEDAYLAELQHVYDVFVARDPRLRAQFPATPPYQRMLLLSEMGLIGKTITLASVPDPHAIVMAARSTR